MYRVFIVDDESEIRRGLVNFFPWHLLGFEVAGQAENGKQALEALLKNTGAVDVLLTDIKMPVMDGIELVKQLRANGVDLKVVLLSAYSDFEYARDGLKLGVVDYALKPTEYNNLMQTFKNIEAMLNLERQAKTGETGKGEHYHTRLVKAARQYIKLNYASASLEDTARYVNLSPSYLSTVFKEETGTSFSDYLLGQKMEHAAQLMRDIDFKTYEISEKVGYSSAKNFTRAFKKYFGVSPREYRNGLGMVQEHDT